MLVYHRKEYQAVAFVLWWYASDMAILHIAGDDPCRGCSSPTVHHTDRASGYPIMDTLVRRIQLHRIVSFDGP